MPFILNFLKSLFPFSDIEEFYLKDTAILIQGILEGYSQSISGIAEHSLVKIERTTLTRFLSKHEEFFKRMKEKLQALLFERGERTFVVDDTHLERKSRGIPYSKYIYEHSKGRYHMAQVLMTIGTFVEGEFTVMDMFFDKGDKSKNALLIDWLRRNGREGYTLISDSWYMHGQIVEACVRWFGMDMIGAVKSNLKFQGEKIGEKEHRIEFDKVVRIRGRLFKIHEEIGYSQSIRIPMKVVFNENENGKRMVMASSNLEMSGEEIIERYLSRWQIETYFQISKANLGLGKCKIRNEKAQENWMVILSIAYYLFEIVKTSLKLKKMKNVKSVLSNAIGYLRFLCEGISNRDYTRLNESFDIFIMSLALSP